MSDKNLRVVTHPLVQHKLSLIRDKNTPSSLFRNLVEELAMLLAYEVTRDVPLTTERVQTPLEALDAPMIEGRRIAFVSILRAGNGLLEGMLRLVPTAGVGHIGIYRDPTTLEAIEYYCKLPPDMSGRDVIIVDPMLATGNSAAVALERVRQAGPRSTKLVCLIAAPEGVAAIRATFPDLPIFTAAVDERLDEKGYIVPGLGDAGDRLYGTR